MARLPSKEPRETEPFFEPTRNHAQTLETFVESMEQSHERRTMQTHPHMRVAVQKALLVRDQLLLTFCISAGGADLENILIECLLRLYGATPRPLSRHAVHHAHGDLHDRLPSKQVVRLHSPGEGVSACRYHPCLEFKFGGDHA